MVLALGLAVSPLGIAGGFLMGLAQSAACSVYTYFVAEVVAKNRVGLGDLKTSIGSTPISTSSPNASAV